jgi:uncharacterized protein (TIGR01777 family)
MQVVVTGATGFIGRPLCAALTGGGHRVTALSRSADHARAALGPQVESLAWGGGAGGEWKQAVRAADAVIHLAGEPIAGGRWTPASKERFRASRVETTRRLVDAIREGDRRPETLVSTSAVGYYGDCRDETITEESPPGDDFLAETCRRWEAEAQRAEEVGVRVVRMRIGIALGAGGALEKMLYPLPLPISPWKLGLGGPLGSGRQWIPWIHLDDVVGLYLWAVTNPQAAGAVNVTAPRPVTNAAFARALARVLGRPALLPVPGFALRLLLGELAEYLLGGQRALPTVAQRSGYTFRYAELDSALRALLQR